MTISERAAALEAHILSELAAIRGEVEKKTELLTTRKYCSHGLAGECRWCLKDQQEPKEVWPKIGEPYLWISTYGEVDRSFLAFDESTKSQSNFLGIFPDTPEGREKAEKKLALVKALCPASQWIPEQGEEWWSWIGTHAIGDVVWDFSAKHHLSRLAQGNVHRTPKDAEAYGKALRDWAECLVK